MAEGARRGLEVKWPTGEAEVGNDGVAAFVKKNAGSIGYVELSTAHREDLDFGLVQNRDGEFVRARLETIMAAADSALKVIPDDLRYSLTDAPGRTSYPICGTTWAIVYRQQLPGKGDKLVHFFRWVLDEGQQYAGPLFYVRLPDALLGRAEKMVDQIRVGR